MKVKKNLVVNPFSKKKESNEVQENNTKDKVSLPSKNPVNHIKCKAVRLKKLEELKKEKKKAKKEERKAKIQRGEPKQVPQTIESLREKDETRIQGNLDDEANEEVKFDIENDEFADYFKKQYEPKVLISYADNPHKKTRIFGRELSRVFPNSLSRYRNRSGIKKMVQSAIDKNFTDIIVINEDQCKPSMFLNS